MFQGTGILFAMTRTSAGVFKFNFDARIIPVSAVGGIAAGGAYLVMIDGLAPGTFTVHTYGTSGAAADLTAFGGVSVFAYDRRT